MKRRNTKSDTPCIIIAPLHGAEMARNLAQIREQDFRAPHEGIKERNPWPESFREGFEDISNTRQILRPTPRGLYERLWKIKRADADSDEGYLLSWACAARVYTYITHHTDIGRVCGKYYVCSLAYVRLDAQEGGQTRARVRMLYNVLGPAV